MGANRSFFRRKFVEARKAARKSRYASLAQEIEHLHAHTFLAPWQQGRIKEIRAMYEMKRQKLGEKHDQLQANLAQEFMQHEVDYIRASTELRSKDRNAEYHPDMLGKMGFFARSFWKKLTAAVPTQQHGEASKA